MGGYGQYASEAHGVAPQVRLSIADWHIHFLAFGAAPNLPLSLLLFAIPPGDGSRISCDCCDCAFQSLVDPPAPFCESLVSGERSEEFSVCEGICRPKKSLTGNPRKKV